MMDIITEMLHVASGYCNCENLTERCLSCENVHHQFREPDVNKHHKILKKMGIFLNPNPNGNVYTTNYYQHRMMYIGMVQFKFRWQGQSKWVNKTQKFRTPDSILTESNYSGTSVREAIEHDPDYMEYFMDNSDCVFNDECYGILGYKYDKNLSDGVKMDIGKYRGKLVTWIIENDPSYIKWFLTNVLRDDELYYYVAQEYFKIYK